MIRGQYCLPLGGNPLSFREQVQTIVGNRLLALEIQWQYISFCITTRESLISALWFRYLKRVRRINISLRTLHNGQLVAEYVWSWPTYTSRLCQGPNSCSLASSLSSSNKIITIVARETGARAITSSTPLTSSILDYTHFSTTTSCQ